MKSIISLLLVIATAYLGACIYLFLSQRSMIYYPVGENFNDDAMALRFDTGGTEVKIWRIGEIADHAVIYFGGNAEDVALAIPDFEGRFPDYTVYLVNYRGYGGSDGEPAEEAIYNDAMFLYDYLKPRFESVSIIARSLGTGVATFIAAQRNVRQLVLVSPFDSLPDVARVHFGFFPVSLLLHERYDSLARADRIRAKTLVILADDDEIIPRGNSMRLVEAMSQTQPVVEIIDDAMHNTIGNSWRYLQLIERFFEPNSEKP